MSPEEVLALGRSRGHLSPPGRGPDPRGACRGAGWAEEGLRERKDRREDLGVHPRGHGWVGLSLADLGRRSCARSWQAEVSEGGSQGRGLGAQGATWTRRCQAGTWPYSPGRLPAGLFIVGDKHTRRHCEHRRTRTPLAFFRSAQRSWEGWGGAGSFWPHPPPSASPPMAPLSSRFRGPGLRAAPSEGSAGLSGSLPVALGTWSAGRPRTMATSPADGSARG